MRLPEPPVLVITDRRQAGGRSIESVAEAAIAGGCRWLSLREKDLAPTDRLALLSRLVALARSSGAMISVHDDVEGALAAGTGAHLPRGASLEAARRRLGAGVLLGASAHDAAEAARAAAQGADYVTLSPIFLSQSKPDYGPALGLDGLAAIARAVRIPVLALGGIETPERAQAALAAGAAGIAVMGGIMRAADPAAAVATLLAALGRDRNSAA